MTGDDAFFLHDTLGFPIDLTREIAGERGRAVDLDGFDAAHAASSARRAQRRGRRSRRGAAGAPVELCRELLDEHGPTEFTGRQEYATDGARCSRSSSAGERVDRGRAEGTTVDVVLDRTPFYAESGGQVGDTGTITTAAGARVVDVDRHAVRRSRARSSCTEARSRSGAIAEGDEVDAAIDGVRRDRIRRNHTATHILHWALREVLGTHVQAGGFAGRRPTACASTSATTRRSRREQLDRRSRRSRTTQIIADAPVRHYETTKAEAERIGAIAFFGEKYGDIVRVLEAGPSTELCGGTHVHALGFIGPIKIVSEGSIGSNLRRIEAVTGDGALARIDDEEVQLRDLADTLQGRAGRGRRQGRAARSSR